MRKEFALWVLVVLAGCASPSLPPDSPTSPANSHAHESKPARAASPLVADEVTTAVVARLRETRGPAERPGASHEMSGMEHSQMPGMNQPAAPKSETNAPKSKEALDAEMKKTSDEMKKLSDEMKKKSDATKSDNKSAAVVYTCPMHPQVQQPNPGKCPICGMTLVKKEPK